MDLILDLMEIVADIFIELHGRWKKKEANK